MSVVAETIVQQIRAIDRNALMAWGYKPLHCNEKGLTFQVSGPKFKGRIQVDLNGRDLYDVKAIKITKKKDKNFGVFMPVAKTHKEVGDVFVESLVSVIDGIVG